MVPQEVSAPRRDADYENRQRQLRMQVDSHGRNLADLQSRNKMLAQQKSGREGRRDRGMGWEGIYLCYEWYGIL